MAGAFRLMQGSSNATASSDASTFVTSYNSLPNATVTVNIPPTQGTHSGNSNYVEVYVSNTVKTAFLPALGISGTTVQARAVAGVEAMNTQYADAVALLDSANIVAATGLNVGNSSSLTVNGSLVVNSKQGGYDQYDQSISSSGNAVQTNASGAISASYMQVSGGVSSPSSISNASSGGVMPLVTSAATAADPLDSLPTPGFGSLGDSATSSVSNGAYGWTRQGALSINNTTTLTPGVYTDIKINAGANVTFNPGLYVLSPTGSGQGLTITGNATVTGSGVLFYLTGSDFNTFSGFYDWRDGSVDLTSSKTLPAAPDPSRVSWASLTINGANAKINLTGYSDSSSSFNNILFYQRRRNQQTVQIQNAGASGSMSLAGVLYAKWGLVQIGSSGTYNTQLVAGALQINNSATVNITTPSPGTGSWLTFSNSPANQVYLVE
jgi:hypothetical protein